MPRRLQSLNNADNATPLQHLNVTTPWPLKALISTPSHLYWWTQCFNRASASTPQQYRRNNSPHWHQHLKASISGCIKYSFLNTLLVPCCELSTHQDVKPCTLTIPTPANLQRDLSHPSHSHYMLTLPYRVILVFILILGTAVGSACMHCHERPIAIGSSPSTHITHVPVHM